MPPQLLPFTFGESSLNTDDVAAVQCMALKGDLPLKIRWYFNDELITTIESAIHVVMTSPRISQLTIEAVTAYHRGVYRCVAENKAGHAEHSSELHVDGTDAWLRRWPKYFGILRSYSSGFLAVISVLFYRILFISPLSHPKLIGRR